MRKTTLEDEKQGACQMAEELKNTGKANLFVIFGEPDVDILDTDYNEESFFVRHAYF